MFKRQIAVLLVAATLPGCSFIFMTPPPPEPVWQRVQYPRCNTTRLWPIADSLIAVTTAAQLLVQTLGLQNDFSNGPDGSDLLSSGITMLAFGASAVVGFDGATRCDGLHRYLEQRRQNPNFDLGPPSRRQPPRQYGPLPPSAGQDSATPPAAGSVPPAAGRPVQPVTPPGG